MAYSRVHVYGSGSKNQRDSCSCGLFRHDMWWSDNIEKKNS